MTKVDAHIVIGAPVCVRCKYFTESMEGPKCQAFQEGIPDEIWYGDNDHSEPLDGQKNDIVFEPLKLSE